MNFNRSQSRTVRSNNIRHSLPRAPISIITYISNVYTNGLAHPVGNYHYIIIKVVDQYCRSTTMNETLRHYQKYHAEFLTMKSLQIAISPMIVKFTCCVSKRDGNSWLVDCPNWVDLIPPVLIINDTFIDHAFAMWRRVDSYSNTTTIINPIKYWNRLPRYKLRAAANVPKMRKWVSYCCIDNQLL